MPFMLILMLLMLLLMLLMVLAAPAMSAAAADVGRVMNEDGRWVACAAASAFLDSSRRKDWMNAEEDARIASMTSMHSGSWATLD